MKILDGIKAYETYEANFECFRLLLNYAGENYSSHYFHGVAGTAFRIGGICPCAPTCTYAMPLQKLINLFGYDYAEIPAEDYNETVVNNMIKAVCESIDNGMPALVWNAFTECEWDIVTGYDENEKVFYGRGSYAGNRDEYAKKEWDYAKNTGASEGIMAIIIKGKIGSFDADSAEISALKEGVRHANDTENADKINSGDWVFLQGKEAYKRWASDFSNPERERGLGDAYCIGIYSSSHRNAGGFLREISPKYPKVAEIFAKAANLFDKEAECLDKLMPLLGWSSPGIDAKRNSEAYLLLNETLNYYSEAIDLLASVVDNL